ncbi:AAA family ATPase [Saccharomonospora cyanea]|uniref:Putative kinase n=1 Tax=Saccharomonospora cyanea NA-134 TaxID=882082 RepID=H5XIU2_9PSEU|nr:AAA family ATPase [Saccharomonospora cyanea]EHR60716.1 putative kinase [Saccharomonospora cyanea NA-134]
MTTTPAITVLIGAPGAGKTTVARTLADRPVVLSLDRARAVCGEHEGDQKASRAAFAHVEKLVHEHLADGLAVAIDATGARRRDRRVWLRLAREHDVPATALVVSAPLEVCLERNADRPPHRRVPDHTVSRMWNTVSALTDTDLISEGFVRVERVTTAPEPN